VPTLQDVTHLIEVERNLGHQNNRGSPGDPGVGRNPAGVSAHDFHDQHPVVRLGRGVQTVDGIGCDLDSGVESEGRLGTDNVVVDSLRHADNRQAFLGHQS
jgi:hypothetical protein